MSVSVIVGIIIGFSLGIMVFNLIFVLGFKYDGTLIVTHDNAGEGPYLFLEFDDYPDKEELERKRYVILKVRKR